MNPDVELLDDSVAKLAHEAARHPDRILAPLVMRPDGSRQDSVHPLPGSPPHIARATTPAPIGGAAVDPWRRNKATRVGWAVGERATILRTVDGGLSWLPVEVSVRATFLSVEFPDEKAGWVVGRGGVILRSDDGGRTWIQQASKTKQNLYALFMDKKMGWAVGGNRMILRYAR